MKIVKTKILPLFLCVVLVATLSLAPKQEAQAVAVSTTIAVVSAVLLSLGLAVNYSDLLGHEPSTEADVQTVLSSIGTSMNLHDNGLGGLFVALVSGVVKGTITIAQATWQRLKSWAGSEASAQIVNDKSLTFDTDTKLLEYLHSIGNDLYTMEDINELRKGCDPLAKISVVRDINRYVTLMIPKEGREISDFCLIYPSSFNSARINTSNCEGTEFYNSVSERLNDINIDTLFVYRNMPRNGVKDPNWFAYYSSYIMEEYTPIKFAQKIYNGAPLSINDSMNVSYVYINGRGYYVQKPNDYTFEEYYITKKPWLYMYPELFFVNNGVYSFDIRHNRKYFDNIIKNGIIENVSVSDVFRQYYPLLFDGTFDVITSGRTAKPIIDAPTDGSAPVYRIDGDVKITIPEDVIMEEAVRQVLNGTKSVTETLPLIDVIPVNTALDKTITVPTTDTDVLYPSIPTTKEEVITVPITIEQAITVTQKMPSSYIFDLRDLFPFCLPFDLYNLYKVFQAEPVAPSFDWDLPVGYENGEVQFETYTINLNIFDEVAFWVRRLELIAFIVGLIYVTRDKFIRS